MGTASDGPVFETVTSALLGLPDYSVRISKRARSPRIIVRYPKEVEVVLPQHMPHSEAAALLFHQKEWVLRTLRRLQTSKPVEEAGELLPDVIDLQCIGQRLEVIYQQSDRATFKLPEEGLQMVISGPVGEPSVIRNVLHKWLKQRAKQVLPEMLKHLAVQHHCNPNRISVRMQKTRWGSCSPSGNISLNAKLLLLPEALAEHVMLHELAHLQHLNHSSLFWQRLESMDPKCQYHRRELRQVYQWMPQWTKQG